MKKRLLITASTFPRYEEDTEPRFILDLAKAMTEYAEVSVLAPATAGAKQEEILEGVHVIRYHYFPVHKWETLCYPGAIVPRIKQKKVRAFLVPWLFVSLGMHLYKMRKEYDIVHANWLIPQGIVQSCLKKPYVVTGHGADVTALNFFPMKQLKHRCLKKAAGVTAVSAPLLDVLNGIYPNDNSEVMSMGCNTQLFGKQHRVEHFFSQGDDKVILFVGRLAEKKGVRYLIEAMQEMKKARLVIVGDGPLREELEQQARRIKDNCGLAKEAIVFLGSKTHEELTKIYASADVFVMPSVTASDGDQEGFGLVMLEACASGLPVVASRSGGIIDLIQDGNNGFLVEERDFRGLADRISALLEDSDLYERMSQASIETAAHYDYKKIAKDYAGFMGLI